MTLPLTTRNATLGDLAELLREQQAKKLDVVVPATAIHSIGGTWHVDGTDADFDDHTFDLRPKAGQFVPTEVADEHAADKLRIPLAYLRRLRAERPDLYDANVNGWLHGPGPKAVDGEDGKVHFEQDPGDQRSFLLRTFRGDDGPGIARALVSDRFGVYDNLDILVSTLEGISESGVTPVIDGCDLSERRMRVRVVVPEVSALAPVLLDGYRSPFGGWTVTSAREAAARENKGYGPGSEPVLWAGFEFGNSETGCGKWYIVPRVVVQMCANGLKFTVDMVGKVHLGARMDEGVIEFTPDTHRRNLELITAQTRDAVQTFVSKDYLARKVAEVEAKAGKALENPADAVKVVTKRLSISESHAQLVLDAFIKGGSTTAGGMLSAVTAAAQLVDDPDDAADLEGLGIQAMELAASL